LYFSQNFLLMANTVAELKEKQKQAEAKLKPGSKVILYYKQNGRFSFEAPAKIAKVNNKSYSVEVLEDVYKGSEVMFTVGHPFNIKKHNNKSWTTTQRIELPESSTQKLDKGTVLVGPSHKFNGIEIKVNDKPVAEAEGGEVVINRKNSKLFCEELSEINQFGGNGVPLNCSNIDKTVTDPVMEKGGEIEDIYKKTIQYLEKEGRELHYLYDKPICEWDEYDISNAKSIIRKKGKIMQQGGELASETQFTEQQLNFIKNHHLDLFNQNKKPYTMEKGGEITIEQKSISWKELPNIFKISKQPKELKEIKENPNDKNLWSLFQSFTAKDELRPVMKGIYFDKEALVATDGHRLIYYPAKTSTENQNKIYAKDGKTIDGRFPNYLPVIPTKFNYVHKGVELLALKVYINAAKNYTNRITNVVSLPLDQYNKDKFISIGFNAVFLTEAIDALLKLGHQKADFYLVAPDKPAVIVPHNAKPLKDVTVLQMPIIVKDKYGKELFDLSKYAAQDIDMGLAFSSFYSLEDNKIHNADGTTSTVNTSVTKEQAWAEYPITKNQYQALKEIVRKNNTSLPILDYIVVDKGVFTTTNLETTIEIDTNGKIKDGFYIPTTEGPLPIPNATELGDELSLKDYPLIPIIKNQTHTAEVSASQFQKLYARCMTTTSNDDLRPVMTGINLKFLENKLVGSSTNGHIIYTDAINAKYTFNKAEETPNQPFYKPNQADITIPTSKAVSKSLETGTGKIIITTNRINSIIKFQDTTITQRVIDQKFPEYQNVLPTDSFENQWTIAVKDLKQVITKAKAFAKGKSNFISVGISENADVYVYYQKSEKHEDVLHSEKVNVESSLIKKTYKPTEYGLFSMPVHVFKEKNEDFALAMGVENLEAIATIADGTEINLHYTNPNKINQITGFSAISDAKPKQKEYVIESKGFTEGPGSAAYRQKQKEKLASIKKQLAEKETKEDLALPNLMKIMNNKVKHQGYSLKQLYDETTKLLGQKEGAVIFSEFIKRKKDEKDKSIIDEFNKTSFVKNIHKKPEPKTEGRTERAIALDKKYKALPPGKRISKEGNTYYEYRPNRTDMDRRKKLKQGGEINNFETEKFLTYSHDVIKDFIKDDLGATLSKEWEFTHNAEKYSMQPYIVYTKGNPSIIQGAEFEINNSKGQKVGFIDFTTSGKFIANSKHFQWIGEKLAKGGNIENIITLPSIGVEVNTETREIYPIGQPEEAQDINDVDYYEMLDQASEEDKKLFDSVMKLAKGGKLETGRGYRVSAKHFSIPNKIVRVIDKYPNDREMVKVEYYRNNDFETDIIHRDDLIEITDELAKGGEINNIVELLTTHYDFISQDDAVKFIKDKTGNKYSTAKIINAYNTIEWDYIGPGKMKQGGEIEDKEFIEYLNEVGESYDYEDDAWIIGGKNRASEWYGSYGLAMKKFDPIAYEVAKREYEQNYEKGGKLGFEGLSKKVAQNYAGKPVPKKYQNEYGKTYSQKEAQEVGNRVAAKIERERGRLKEEGGLIDETIPTQQLTMVEKHIASHIKPLHTGTKVTFNGNNYKVAEIQLEGINLQHVPEFRSEDRKDIFVYYDELLNKTDEGKLKVEGFNSSAELAITIAFINNKKIAELQSKRISAHNQAKLDKLKEQLTQEEIASIKEQQEKEARQMAHIRYRLRQQSQG